MKPNILSRRNLIEHLDIIVTLMNLGLEIKIEK